MKVNETVQKAPQFRILSLDQIERLYFATLDVLELSGCVVNHDEALELLADSDAVITDNNRVRIPASLVERALKSIPSKVSLSGKNGKRTVNLQKDEVAFGTGSNISHVYDKQKDEHRVCTLEDVADSAKLADALSNIDLCMDHGPIQETEGNRKLLLKQFLLMLKNCSKPTVLNCKDKNIAAGLWEMASVIRGNEDELRVNPLFAMYTCPEHPLALDKNCVDLLFFCTEKRIPIIHLPYVIAGVNAPASIAGLFVQTLCASLTAAVLCYLKKPGVPFVLGARNSIAQGEGNAPSFGGPELSLTMSGLADLAKWLKIPCINSSGITDSKVVDQQAAMESSLNLFNAFLCGSNIVQDVGCINSGTTSSLESLIMCNEIIGMIKQIGKGLLTDDEHMSYGLIHKVGPGGEFVSQDHTFQFWREWFMPKLLSREDFQTWKMSGQKTMDDVVIEEKDQILKSHNPVPLEDDVLQELDAIANKY
jgi:trimethylamine--corrinoid protein Co-methyltransferase